MHTHISVPPLSWAQLALHQLLVALAPLHELTVRAHVDNALLVDENDLRRLAHRAQGLRAWAFGLSVQHIFDLFKTARETPNQEDALVLSACAGFECRGACAVLLP